MNLDDQLLQSIFDPALLEACPDEWGLVIHSTDPHSIGFATTLTPDVIHQAVAKEIDLLVTHHDAWEFMREERDICLQLLAQRRISHVWCHAPLDAADFGTAASLLAVAGCKVIGSIAEGDGRIGELPAPLSLTELVKLLDGQLSESPCRRIDANRMVARIACVPGAGMNIGYLVEALNRDADLYITGETGLYLLEYASFRKVNVLVYSHNYTEIFGTQNLAHKIAVQLGIKEIVRLDEPHY